MSDQNHENLSCVHDLVAAAAAAHPDRIALAGAHGRLTYRELDARAERIAGHLAARGVGLDTLVGVFLERSAEFVVAVLAVLKAGGHYLPLDPDYPAARLQLMLQAAAPGVVLTTGILAPRLPVGTSVGLPLEELERDHPAPPPLPRTHPDNLAYAMFTSGSTGVPKGVLVPHRGVVRLVRRPGYARLDENEVVLQLSSTSFDASTFEIWGALANGGRLVIGPPGRVSVMELGDLLRRHGVTTAFLTTGLFHLMVDENLEALGGLAQLITGGDVLSPERAHRVRTRFPDCRLVNAYGPTEVTAFTTCHDVGSTAGETGIPIGTPIGQTWVRLLDDDLLPVPDGTPGQLYAGGSGLARGYLGDPALTARRFVPDPWLPGQRLYATGDLARRRPDGTLEYLGRADQQIKRRGFRVEPGEIEQALRGDELLRDAVVLPEGAGADDRILVAYLVPEQSPAGLVEPVRDRLRERLPDHLIPDRWAVVDALPLNPNGKVDRRALAERAAVTVVDGAAGESIPGNEPEGEIETALAAIWRELFELDRIGRHDDFFELGGHSLLASRMVARVRRTLGVQLPLVAVFDNPTVAEVADLVRAG